MDLIEAKATHLVGKIDRILEAAAWSCDATVIPNRRDVPNLLDFHIDRLSGTNKRWDFLKLKPGQLYAVGRGACCDFEPCVNQKIRITIEPYTTVAGATQFAYKVRPYIRSVENWISYAANY